MVIYVIYCHRLPLYLICGGAPHQIQHHFCLIPTKMPRKEIFRHPGGMHLHPLHPMATPMTAPDGVHHCSRRKISLLSSPGPWQDVFNDRLLSCRDMTDDVLLDDIALANWRRKSYMIYQICVIVHDLQWPLKITYFYYWKTLQGRHVEICSTTKLIATIESHVWATISVVIFELKVIRDQISSQLQVEIYCYRHKIDGYHIRKIIYELQRH